jgi:hypothetical protein
MNWFFGLSLLTIAIILIVLTYLYVHSLFDYVSKHLLELQTQNAKNHQRTQEDMIFYQSEVLKLKDEVELLRKRVEEKKGKESVKK